MNLQQHSLEELQELSMIELTHVILENKKQAIYFPEIVQEISETLNMPQEEVASRIAQFYTDLNIDGRFISVGENRWGLRSWYPYEQMEEEILPQAKPKKKRKYDEEDLLDDYIAEDDFEEVDDIEDLDVLEDDYIDEDDVDAFEDEDIIEEEDELVEIEEEDADLIEEEDELELDEEEEEI